MTRKTLRLFCVLGVLVIAIGAVLCFTLPYAQSSPFPRLTFPRLTVQAWNDASYSSGSRKWMFYYESQVGSSQEEHLNFPFPFFPMPSGIVPPILISVLSTSGQSEMEGRLLNTTAGTSYTWDGMEITVATANPSYVVLVLEPLT